MELQVDPKLPLLEGEIIGVASVLQAKRWDHNL